LLEARKKDPSYASVTIPQLSAELVNGDISKFYLGWLEGVHRAEAYKQYLNKKEEAETATLGGINNAQVTAGGPADIATLKRRRNIFDKIERRRKEAQHDVGTSK
jgi:hypothetical protein